MNVLVVCGDDAVCEMLLAVASDLGYHPQCVTHDGALSHYEQGHAPLVVIDIAHPKQCGLDLCRRIRAADAKRESFVLVLTSDGSKAELEGLLEAGADDYLIKAMTPDDIRARLLIAQQRMAHDARRRDAEEALARARWLAGIGETSIALQHEINNPLTALLGHAELMLMDADDGGAFDANRLRVIHEQARRIAEVVKRLGRLRDPQTVEYAAGARMIDLSEQAKDEL